MKNKLLSWGHLLMIVSRATFYTMLVSAIEGCVSDPASNVVFHPSGTTLEQSAQSTHQISQPDLLVQHTPQTARDDPPAVGSSIRTTYTKETIVAEKDGKQISAASTMEPAPVTRVGSAAYYIPKEMIEARASMVDLWIDRTTTVEQLQKDLAAQLQITADKIKFRNMRDRHKPSGAPTLAQLDGVTIPIGDTMIAQLRGGDDFTIEPKEPVTQFLKNENRTKWNWRVTPKHESKIGIDLDLDIWIDPGPGKHLIDSYHESVLVYPRPRTYYERAQDIDRWIVLFGIGGIGGLFTAVLKWYRKRNTT